MLFLNYKDIMWPQYGTLFIIEKNNVTGEVSECTYHNEGMWANHGILIRGILKGGKPWWSKMWCKNTFGGDMVVRW